VRVNKRPFLAQLDGMDKNCTKPLLQLGTHIRVDWLKRSSLTAQMEQEYGDCNNPISSFFQIWVNAFPKRERLTCVTGKASKAFCGFYRCCHPNPWIQVDA
jgi:hypothetical protein